MAITLMLLSPDLLVVARSVVAIALVLFAKSLIVIFLYHITIAALLDAMFIHSTSIVIVMIVITHSKNAEQAKRDHDTAETERYGDCFKKYEEMVKKLMP